jgi:hypothetical protein
VIKALRAARTRKSASSRASMDALFQREPMPYASGHARDEATAPDMEQLRGLHTMMGVAHAALGELLANDEFSFLTARANASNIAEYATQIYDMLLSAVQTTDNDVGEVTPRSVVKPAGPTDVDHRKDFKSGAKDGPIDEPFGQRDSRKPGGAADSALFDAKKLFQK